MSEPVRGYSIEVRFLGGLGGPNAAQQGASESTAEHSSRSIAADVPNIEIKLPVLMGSGAQEEVLAQTAPLPEHVAEDPARLREMLPVPDAQVADDSPPVLPPDPPQDLDRPREHGSLNPQPEGG